MKKITVHTPFRTFECTITEWIAWGSDVAQADVDVARKVDPTGHYRTVLEMESQ